MAVSVSWFLQFLAFALSCSFILARIQTESENSGELSGPDSDLVTNLPGQPAVNFKHFAGYVKLRQEDEKALFYWFFEARDHVAERPLVLCLNGGPGCSSVAYGAAQDSELVLNKFSWNKAANLLFLEAPVGVGYSYTNNSADLNNRDKVTAEDSHAFLVEWFKKFPKFKSNEFYIAGESYAGHYIPQLAELVYARNKGVSKDTVINFKGFMDLWHTLPSGYDPCAGDYTIKYFNRKDVQHALHANVTKLNYPYTLAAHKFQGGLTTLIPLFLKSKKLLNAGLRIWVYSGDTDGRVPIASTRNSINEMKLKVKDEWRSWFHRDQVAGWVNTYENGLTLATVRGAGH